METTVSSKGQVVIPKEVRDRHGLEPGTRLLVEERGDVIVLRRADGEKRYTVDDLLALPRHYDGPPKTDAEIAQALDDDVRRRWKTG